MSDFELIAIDQLTSITGGDGEDAQAPCPPPAVYNCNAPGSCPNGGQQNNVGGNQIGINSQSQTQTNQSTGQGGFNFGPIHIPIALPGGG